MMIFKEVEAEDIPLITKYFGVKNFRTCDFSIGGMFMWRKYFDTSYAIHEDCLFFKIKYFDDLICFTYPLGYIPDDKALGLLENYIIDNNLTFNLCTVPEEALSILRERYNDRLAATPTRNWFDYLYQIDDLINLRGKKYNGARNHINKFLKLYPQYRYQKIGADNIDKIQQFLNDNRTSFLKDSETALQEYSRSSEILSYFELFQLEGGYIEWEDKIIAFTVGEIINDTLFVHIEKALIEYQGVYQLLANEFVKQFDTDVIKYVNREEDVGDPGLRKAKLSYHPIKLLSKYLVSIR
jgi:hypothetical protein